MDNSLNDPITTLDIVAQTLVEDSPIISEKNSPFNKETKKFYYCDVHFSTQSDRTFVATSVQSPDITWANSTLLALEEQIERTFQRGFWSKVCHSTSRPFLFFLLLMALVYLVMGVFHIYQGQYDLSERMWLTKNEVAQLLSKTDEKFSPVEAYQFQLKNLQYYDQNALSWKSLLSWKTYVILIPSVIIIIVFLYLLFQCYPVAVFNWGDMSEWYNNICSKRKKMWDLITGTIIIGLFVNIAASVFVGWFQ
jgi:hypothetical protein